MTTQYSPILKLALPVQGELSGTWGDVVNDNITSMVEQAIAGRAVINTWSTNSHTLTSANGTTSESRCAMLELTDTGTSLSAAGTVICPALSKIYIVKNAAGQNITVKTASGTGILVPNGRTTFLFCDGTNVVEAMTHTTSLQLGTSTTVTAVLDEDNMASNSATSLATQQSIKAYVDAQVGAFDSLAEVLAVGNTTGGTDLLVSTGDDITFADNSKAIFGAGSDLQIYHDGAASYVMDTGTGNLQLRGDNSVALRSYSTTDNYLVANFNGSVDLYYDNALKLATTSTGVDVTGNATFADNGKAIFGAGSDLEISSNGASGIIRAGNASSDIRLESDNRIVICDRAFNETFAVFNDDGDVKLYYDNAPKLATTSTGIAVTGNANFADNGKAVFGAGSDLKIYHDGDNNYVDAAGVGHLYLQSQGTDKDVKIQSDNGSGGLTEYFRADGSLGQAQMFYYGSQRLNTTLTGINVTGNIANASGDLTLDVAGDIILNADGGDIKFQDGGSNVGSLINSSGFVIKSDVSDADIKFQGIDNVSTITALTLDISAAGAATFNSSVTIPTTAYVGTSIVHQNDTDTSIDFDTNLIDVYAGGVLGVRVQPTAVTINEAGADYDFRVESDTDTHALFVDAGKDVVSIGNGAPETWYGGYDVLQLGLTASFVSNETSSDTDVLQLMENSYLDTSATWRFMEGSTGATRLQMTGQGIQFYMSETTGAADSAITWQSQLRMDTSGVTVNEGGLDQDFRVESDTDTHALFVDASSNTIGLGLSNPSSSYKLNVNGNIRLTGTAGTVRLEAGDTSLSADQLVGRVEMYANDASTGGTGVAGYIEVKSDDQYGVNSYMALGTRISDGSGNPTERLKITKFGGLIQYPITGGDVILNENGVDADFRVESDSNTHALFVDAGNNRIGMGEADPDGPLHLKTSDAGTAVKIESTNGGTGHGPNLRLLRSSPTPADNDMIGRVNINGMNSAGEELTYAQILGQMRDVTDGTEDSRLKLGGQQGGTFVNYFDAEPTETVINQDGVDRDFRVESDANANMFVVNAGDSTVGIGTTPSTNYRTLTVVNALDTDNSQIHIHGGNAGIYIGESYTGGFGSNAAIARALVGGYHVSSSLVGDLCIGAETDAGIRFGTQVGGSGLTNRMYISKNGAVSIAGSLSKGSGSFNIDHPLPAKSATHNLVHSFVEAPQADNIYRGKVDLVAGQASVNIDTVAGMTEGTFAALNREVQCFTSNETGWIAVRGSVSGNTLTIEAQDNTCTDTVSWLVVGERQDQHMYDTEWTDENGKVIVEPLKDNPQP